MSRLTSGKEASSDGVHSSPNIGEEEETEESIETGAGYCGSFEEDDLQSVHNNQKKGTCKGV